MSSHLERRDFLKVLGIGGAAATLAGCGNTSIDSGVETVMSYVKPEDFVVPGNSVFYASTCTLCPSHCGIKGRVREGRILKLEGNPLSHTSGGKICALGQAAVQVQYNPDRLNTPMVREGGSLVPATWDKAMGVLRQQLGPQSGLKGDQVAFLTNETSGHQRVLMESFLESFGSKNWVVYDALSTETGRRARAAVLGSAQPQLHIDRARMILSFGHDFLGAGPSPVALAAQYGKFRKAPRGTLVVVEPRMTLTGANADRWYAIRPGTEGIFALGLARELTRHGDYAGHLPKPLLDALSAYDKETVSNLTGVHAEAIPHLASMLWEKSPSLVLSGPSAEGHEEGEQNARAILLLNIILGNVGKTLEGPAASPFPQMEARNGTYKALNQLNGQMAAGHVKALLIHGSNPMFTAPAFLKMDKSLAAVPFKVAFTTQLDETSRLCDVVLPIHSPLEDFGSWVPSYQSGGVQVGIQQPFMEPLSADTRPFGDLLLDLLKTRDGAHWNRFPDYYTYLRSAMVSAKPVFKSHSSDDDFWEDTLRAGVLSVSAGATALKPQVAAVNVTKPQPRATEVRFPFFLVPSARHDMQDGRYANLPWLQESPDSLTTVVWDSWVEIHPTTAHEMQIREGDILEIQSATGTLKAKAYLYPGIQKDTLSVPIGQGHTDYGRYANGIGSNPFKLFDPHFDRDTGEWALYATRVALKKTGEHARMVKDEGATNVQQGRKLVATVAADQMELGKEVTHVTR
jgi:molybdopterin-containing oxidoreductase family iron-sulfur binding subunit